MSEVREGLLELLPSLRRYAGYLTEDPQFVDDLLHDTIVRALRSEHAYQPGSNLKGWLRFMMRNAWYNHLTLRRRERNRLMGLSWSVEQPPAQESAVMLAETLEHLARLHPNRRHAIVSRAIGYSVAECAAEAGTTELAICQRSHRGRAQLRAASL